MAFSDNPTFRGMRQSLLEDFDEIYVLNLHGGAKKREQTPGGGKDENVFDIQQGVAITLFVRRADHGRPAKVLHADLWGLRAKKYERLAQRDVTTVPWKKLSPSTPYYFFVPRSERYRREYERCWKVTEAFPLNPPGIVTARDQFVVDLDLASLKRRIDLFCNREDSDEAVKTHLRLKENYAWRIDKRVAN